MKSISDRQIKKSVIFLIFAVAVVFTGIIGCASKMPISQKPGAMLWGENCGRCHNVRPPASLTDGQWEVAVLHMRTRANLTATEAEKIVSFLKAAN